MKLRHILRYPEDGGGGGGGGQVSAADARAFLTNFVPDPKALETMPEPDVLAYHGRVKGFHDKSINDAVTKVKAEATWPDDWRQRLSDKDEKELKQLERYASPAEVWKKARELEKKVSAGELKASVPFPEKGTPEEQTAWRKEMGIPEKPEAYDLTLANGVVIGDEDKPLVDEFLKFAHSKHTPPDAVKATLEWFLGDYREGIQEKAAEAKAQKKQQAEDALRKEWGNDYRPNMTAIDNLLAANVSSNPELAQRIKASIEIEPEFAKLWANIARQINPVTTLTGIDPARMEQSVSDEIAKIETTMRTNRPAYNRDEKMQARYRELLDARERMKGGQRAA